MVICHNEDQIHTIILQIWVIVLPDFFFMDVGIIISIHLINR